MKFDLFLFFSPAVSEFEVEADFEECFVVLDCLCDGHLHLVAQELGLLVRSLDFLQNLLDIGGLEFKTVII